MHSKANDSVRVQLPEALSGGGVVGQLLAAKVGLLELAGGREHGAVVAGEVQRDGGQARPVRAPRIEGRRVAEDVCNRARVKNWGQRIWWLKIWEMLQESEERKKVDRKRGKSIEEEIEDR